MAAFIIRRLIWTIPVILLVILMTFVMMKQIGGNPFRRSERPVPPRPLGDGELPDERLAHDGVGEGEPPGAGLD